MLRKLNWKLSFVKMVETLHVHLLKNLG